MYNIQSLKNHDKCKHSLFINTIVTFFSFIYYVWRFKIKMIDEGKMMDNKKLFNSLIN